MGNRGDRPVLRPPRSLRMLAWAVAVLAALLAVVTVLLLLYGVIFPGCCTGIAACVLAIVVTPILSGRAEARQDELYTRADPAKTFILPWREISAMETRRRLLTEVVAIHRGEEWLELGAPRRWRFRADPAFTAAADDLAARAHVALERGGRRTSLRKLAFRFVLAVLYVVVFVTLDPVWHSPLWPGRAEAAALPAACPVIAADAARLGGGRPQVQRHSDRSGRHDLCSYEAALMLEYEGFRYAVGVDGGREQARRAYEQWVSGHPLGKGTARRPVAGLGDAATMLVSTYPGHPDRVDMVNLSVLRANILVRLVYEPKDGELGGRSVTAATATARRLAGTAVARIAVR